MRAREISLKNQQQSFSHRLSSLRSRVVGQGDDMLILSCLVLTALGLVMVYSASVYVAEKHFKTDWSIFFRQFRFLIIGFLALFAGMFVDVQVYKKWIKVGMVVLVVMMALQLFTPLGPVIANTRRWFNFGIFKLQTSDLARCFVVVFLAKALAKEPDLARRPNLRFWMVLGFAGVPILLTNLQPDLSGSLMIAAVAGLVLFLGGMSFLNTAVIGSLAVPGVVYLALRHPYQIRRLTEFIGSRFSGERMEYQTLQSLIGFGRGGFLGVGLGQGKQKMLFLPEPHTDFIFSIVGEELGLIGAAAVLGAFIVLGIRMIRIVHKQSDRFSFLLGSGLAASIILFAMVNMGVAIGLLPVTGLPLPFISSGGTNLIVSLWSVGVLWNLSRYSSLGYNGLSKTANRL